MKSRRRWSGVERNYCNGGLLPHCSYMDCMVPAGLRDCCRFEVFRRSILDGTSVLLPSRGVILLLSE